LCEQAAIEQNPIKLLALISEINRLLEAKEQRLKNVRGSTFTPLPLPLFPSAGRTIALQTLWSG